MHNLVQSFCMDCSTQHFQCARLLARALEKVDDPALCQLDLTDYVQLGCQHGYEGRYQLLNTSVMAVGKQSGDVR